MPYPLNNYPSLTKSYKGLFPFKICTTSFIYPDHYIPNVKMLGPYLDEIELLLFESRGIDVLPTAEEIAELGRLAAEFNLTYNVHLPTDVSISDRDPARRRHAIATIIRVMERVRPLGASAMVLHIPYEEKTYAEPIVAKWQDRVYDSLANIKSAAATPHIIAIETLDYPLDWVAQLGLDLDMRICLDLGHLMVYEYDLLRTFNAYGSKTSVLHLHGVENDRDHLSLDRLSETAAATVLQVLEKYRGVVSLEVFSFEKLTASLKFIENQFLPAGAV